jgi:hypothetical protein
MSLPKTDTAFLPYLEKGKKLYKKHNILYQTPKSVKKCHQMSSTVNQSLTQRTQRRLFSRNELMGTNKHTQTTLQHFSVDDSLHSEITVNYNILFHHLHVAGHIKFGLLCCWCWISCWTALFKISWIWCWQEFQTLNIRQNCLRLV